MPGVLGVLLGVGGAPGAITVGSFDASDPAGCALQLNNDGTFALTGTPGGAWVAPASAAVAAFYQVKVDPTSGSFSGGSATGTWLDLSTTRGWVRSAGDQVTFTISFREKATGLVRATLTGQLFNAT